MPSSSGHTDRGKPRTRLIVFIWHALCVRVLSRGVAEWGSDGGWTHGQTRSICCCRPGLHVAACPPRLGRSRSRRTGKFFASVDCGRRNDLGRRFARHVHARACPEKEPASDGSERRPAQIHAPAAGTPFGQCAAHDSHAPPSPARSAAQISPQSRLAARQQLQPVKRLVPAGARGAAGASSALAVPPFAGFAASRRDACASAASPSGFSEWRQLPSKKAPASTPRV